MKIKQTNGRLPEWAASMAVVTNAGGLVGKQQGEQVDAFGRVARFNNFSTAAEFVPDVGKKTSVWISSFYLDIVNPRQEFEAVFVPLPVELSRRYIKRPELEERYRDRTTYIPLQTFEDLRKQIPNPSTGVAFIWWMFSEFGKVDRRQLFGFEFFKPGIRHHYGDDKTACLHDGRIERTVFEKITY